MLTIIQIAIAIVIIVLILLQERSSGMSGLFGGDSGGLYQTRRGMEKTMFYLTIIMCIAFVGIAVFQLYRP